MVKITAGIDGMMCNMCEAHMNDAVRNSFKVKKVSSSHTDKRSVIIAKEDIPEDKLREVVEKTGYKLTSYESEPYEKKGLFK